MLDAPPQEPRGLSWLYVALASLIIFATIPIARSLQSFVSDRLGPDSFLYISAAVVAAAAVWAVRFLKRRHTPAIGYLWLLAVAIAYASYAFQLRRNPIEAIHLIEYGLLSILVFRALVHRIRDVSIYLIAILVVGIIGVMDEWIQWIVPSRFWDLRDVQINLIAASLTQLAIGAGLRPQLVSGWPSAANMKRLCAVIALGLTMLGLSYAHTPARIAAYATSIPGLSFLLSSKSMMVEYGYFHEDPDIGNFRSRFTLEELEKHDRDRGLELAKAFDDFISDEKFGEFQELYSVPRDAYIHEAGIHLFRRNRYLDISMTQETRRFLHYNIALRENQILEKYFPTGLDNSTHVWTDDIKKHVDGLADKDPVYESRVSKDLITRASERQVFSAFGIGVILFGLLAVYFARESQPTKARPASNEGARE